MNVIIIRLKIDCQSFWGFYYESETFIAENGKCEYLYDNNFGVSVT